MSVVQVRAKFRCNTVEQSTLAPVPRQTYRDGQLVDDGHTWPRKYRFSAVYDSGVAEDRRYAQATPYGELTIQVDNPHVVFEPGTCYYLDFTPVPAPADTAA